MDERVAVQPRRRVNQYHLCKGDAIIMENCKKLSRKNLRDFAKTVIEELGLTNNEVMLYLYGGKKQCPDCKELHLFIDRFCPECYNVEHDECVAEGEE